jgi:hypothetical protein
MLPTSLVWILSLCLLSGALAAESFYKILGGELLWPDTATSTRRNEALIDVVGRDASETELKKAYRVSCALLTEDSSLARRRIADKPETVQKVSSGHQSRRGGS